MSNRVIRKTDKHELCLAQVTYEGDRYAPVTHKEVIEVIDSYIVENSLPIRSESYLQASNGQRMVGKLVFDYPDKEGGYLVSYKNSLDGSMSFGMASGFHTFICSNGSVFGDHSSFKRKHLGSAKEEILHQISFVMSQMEEVMKQHINFREQLKEKVASKKLISELSGRLFMDNEIIRANQLAIIKKEVENPTYDYKCNGTAYEFYQHCTLALRDSTPISWHKQHEQLSSFFVNEFGIILNKEEMSIEDLVEQEQFINQEG